MADSNKPGEKPSKKTGFEPEKEEKKGGFRRAKEEPVVYEAAFPVVGIGASAGGIEAFTSFLNAMPGNTGMAFVFIQHQPPSRVSMLPDILSRLTEMPVQPVRNGIKIEPNHVYVLPPGADLFIRAGKLHLEEFTQGGVHMPIDYFFRSLADELGARAIGVVLSGTATDGTLGLKAIKAEGGITFSQDEKSAKYDGMPSSAINSGCVDMALPPDEIAQELVKISKHPYLAPSKKAGEEEFAAKETLQHLFILLRNSSGVDFSYYKPTTIQRRLKRRMILHKIERLDVYVRYLQDTPGEVEALYEDLLINVTGFFRDPESFDALKEAIYPEITKDRSMDHPIRIWVPGCATGEEPYSIAMSLIEYLSEKAPAGIQIFATDIDEKALEKARAGKYPENIAAELTPERLKRFFVRTERGYQISKQIRDMCIFAKHNLIKDPPFSKIDLVSCRNVLIYLEPFLQKKIIPVFHYSLNPSGFLMLGSSETIGSFSYLFSLVDKNHKIYLKKASNVRPSMHIMETGRVLEIEREEKAERKDEHVKYELKKEAERIVLAKYAPASVVINPNMDIIQFSGNTGFYLQHPTGTATLNIFKMAREGLFFELRKAINECLKTGMPVQSNPVRIRYNNKEKTLKIDIIPLADNARGIKNYIVAFDDKAFPERDISKKSAKTTKDEREKEIQIEELRQELSSTKDYLQSIIEEQESANEELKSANEEILATNEEIQSTNEELETAKEELQSTNEELATVNDELESRNSELSRLNADLNNLLSSTNIPLVIVDKDLRIRVFTPMTEKILSLIQTDIGRPLGDIKSNFNQDLEKLTVEVVENGKKREFEAEDRNGSWYLIRILPYMTLDNKIEGAVILFIDINESRKAIDNIHEAVDFSRSVMAAIHTPLTVLDMDFNIISASDSFYKAFKTDPDDVIGQSILSIFDGKGMSSGIVGILEEVKKGEINHCVIESDSTLPEPLRLSISGKLANYKGGTKSVILLQIENLDGKNGHNN